MFGTQNCAPNSAPRCSRKWNYRKSGMSKHRKAKKERRSINHELHSLKTETIDMASDICEQHLNSLKDININHPPKRNGSAKSLRRRHPKRQTKKVPVGHSGWATVHGPVCH